MFAPGVSALTAGTGVFACWRSDDWIFTGTAADTGVGCQNFVKAISGPDPETEDQKKCGK
jgi:hypothetical protein